MDPPMDYAGSRPRLMDHDVTLEVSSCKGSDDVKVSGAKADALSFTLLCRKSTNFLLIT